MNDSNCNNNDTNKFFILSVKLFDGRFYEAYASKNIEECISQAETVIDATGGTFQRDAEYMESLGYRHWVEVKDGKVAIEPSIVIVPMWLNAPSRVDAVIRFLKKEPV